VELYSLVFYIFSFLSLSSAFMVIISRNPVYSVLWLVMTFFNIAGIFILLGAEFLAMVLVIVYVGAIAVLFLFVVMMLNVNYEALRANFHKLLPLCFLVALVFIGDLYLVFNQSILKSVRYAPPANVASRDVITSSVFAESKFEIPNLSDLTNTESLGEIVYTNYIYCFQLAGAILLLAMISSIVLTLRERRNYRKQNVNRQVSMDKKRCVEIVQVQVGKGVNV
jgi:NADH-quinone oxidoreductase subunit J